MEASQPGAPEPDERTEEERAADEEQARQEEQDNATPGEQGEQVAQPAPALGQDVPVRTSAPSPDSQSGVPLASDREAGVEAGPVHPEEGEGEGENAEPAE